MHLTIRLVCFFFMISIAASASARNYVVEVIIFENGKNTEQREELWRPESNQVNIRTAELQTLKRIAKIPTTRTGTSRLKRLESSLQGSGHRVLQSARWVLNAKVYQNATTFNLSTANIKAFLKIYKTALIFADLNMGLIANAPASEEELQTGLNRYTPPAPLYFINEKRRLKFKEIHYFDHPKFGAIIGVWPA